MYKNLGQIFEQNHVDYVDDTARLIFFGLFRIPYEARLD